MPYVQVRVLTNVYCILITTIQMWKHSNCWHWIKTQIPGFWGEALTPWGKGHLEDIQWIRQTLSACISSIYKCVCVEKMCAVNLVDSSTQQPPHLSQKKLHTAKANFVEVKHIIDIFSCKLYLLTCQGRPLVLQMCTYWGKKITWTLKICMSLSLWVNQMTDRSILFTNGELLYMCMQVNTQQEH